MRHPRESDEVSFFLYPSLFVRLEYYGKDIHVYFNRTKWVQKSFERCLNHAWNNRLQLTCCPHNSSSQKIHSFFPRRLHESFEIRQNWPSSHKKTAFFPRRCNGRLTAMPVHYRLEPAVVSNRNQTLALQNLKAHCKTLRRNAKPQGTQICILRIVLAIAVFLGAVLIT